MLLTGIGHPCYAAAMPIAAPGTLPRLPGAEEDAPGPWAGIAHATLPQAADILEQATGDALIEIRATCTPGAAGFVAVMASRDAFLRIRVSVRGDGGAHVEAVNIPRRLLGHEGRAYIRSSGSARLAPSDAIRIAEAVTGATADHARLTNPLSPGNAVLGYLVEGGTGRSHPFRIVIDAESGNVIANPVTLLDHRSPEQLVSRPR